MAAQSDESVANPLTFRELALSDEVLKALTDVGYESPSPIQAATIPPLLAGKDVLGQAQTGTGKTAAFALPLLSKIDLSQKTPQALVLVPTRELAIQVAEAFQRYASHLRGFHVLPIYGGQSYTPQLQSLRRGVHVVVGTPGRMMDHMKRGTLDLSALSYLVLDEADEMLRMGFIDDVEWILQQTPPTRQVALFSATMPTAVRRIAQTHLRSPTEITIKSKTSTGANIKQYYWVVGGMQQKLDALTRILEAEPIEGMLIFTRTKQATVELAEKLESRGFSAEPLNGDIQQSQREKTIARLKSGQVDIVVATDVAARGLDVERIGHVINFDVPFDSESYVHRIGRTGRAGRTGIAILFVSPRERNMLRVIERATRQVIEPLQMPSIADVNQKRVDRFKERITQELGGGGSNAFRPLIEEYEREYNVPAIEIAAALASIFQGKSPMLLDERAQRSEPFGERPRDYAPPAERQFDAPPERQSPRPPERARTPAAQVEAVRPSRKPEPVPQPAGGAKKERRKWADDTLETFRVEVGHVHGIKAGNIVGAIANEAGIEGQHIGRVDIREDHSFVDLPEGMPKEIFRELHKVRVGGQMLQISRALRPKTTLKVTYTAPKGPPKIAPKPHRKGKRPQRG